MTAFLKGFALGQQAWNDAQRMKLLEEQERRAKESHEANMARERDAADERARQKQYKSELAAADTNASDLMPKVGLRVGSQQAQMLADQDAAFGLEGQQATLASAAPAAGLRDAPQIRQRDFLDAAMARRAIASRYGNIQDANAYDVQFETEHRRWNLDAQRKLGSILNSIRDDATPEQIRQLLSGVSGIVDSTGYARGGFVERDGKLVPLVGSGGVFSEAGAGVPLTPQAARMFVEQAMQIAADPSKMGELRRAQQLHAQTLEKNAQELFVGEQTMVPRIQSAQLGPANIASQIGLRTAQGDYYNTMRRVASDREGRLAAQENDANNYFPAQPLVDEKTGRVSYVQMPKRAGLEPRVSPMPEGYRQPRDINADMTLAAGIAKETGVPIGVALRQVEAARSGYDPDAVLTENLRKMNEEAAAARAKQGQGQSGGGMRIPKSSAETQREQAAATKQVEQSKQLMRLTDEWIEVASTLDLSTLRPRDALRLREKYWAVMTPEERAAVTRRAQ